MDVNTRASARTHTHTHTHIYIYIYMKHFFNKSYIKKKRRGWINSDTRSKGTNFAKTIMIQETQSKETNYDNMTFIQKLVHILLVLTNKNNYIYTSWSWSPSLWSSSPQVTTTIIKKKTNPKKMFQFSKIPSQFNTSRNLFRSAAYICDSTLLLSLPWAQVQLQITL